MPPPSRTPTSKATGPIGLGWQTPGPDAPAQPVERDVARPGEDVAGPGTGDDDGAGQRVLVPEAHGTGQGAGPLQLLVAIARQELRAPHAVPVVGGHALAGEPREGVHLQREALRERLAEPALGRDLPVLPVRPQAAEAPLTAQREPLPVLGPREIVERIDDDAPEESAHLVARLRQVDARLLAGLRSAEAHPGLDEPPAARARSAAPPRRRSA